MAYIGDYMRGASADTGMPSIIGLQQYIQQGFDAGRAQGQNQQLAQLAQSAYNDTGAQQSQDVSRAIGINPQAGLALGNAVGAQTAQQRQTATLQKLGKVASAIVAAKQRGDETTAEGLYQAALPELRMFASERGAPPPPNSVDGSDMGAMYKLAVMFGNGLPAAQKYAVAAPGSAIFDPATGTVKTSVPNRGQVVGGYYFDPNTGTASPIPINGAQNGAAVAAPVPGNPQGIPPQATGAPNIGQPAPASVVEGNVPAGAQVTQATGPDGARVAFAFAPGTADAVKSQAGAVAGIPQSAPPASTLAGALQSKGQVHTLTPAEVKAAGLPEGTVAQVAPDGKIAVVSKPGGQSGAPMQFGDPTKTGATYLSTLEPQIASQVKALDEGRLQFPSSFALKTPYWQGMLAAVSRYDPSFDAINYNARASARKAFTSGKEAQQVNALNTVAQHLAQLQGYANALQNRSFTPYNAVVNAAESKLGNPAPTNFDRTVLPVAQELERVWRGTGGSEADIQQWIKNMSSSSSPEQFKEAFSGLSDLIYGKLAALRDQYVQAMGTTADPYRFLSPRTQTIFSHLDSLDAGKFANDATAGNNITANSQQAQQSSAPSGVDSLLSKYGIQ